jgi:hypothetical protein
MPPRKLPMSTFAYGHQETLQLHTMMHQPEEAVTIAGEGYSKYCHIGLDEFCSILQQQLNDEKKNH